MTSEIIDLIKDNKIQMALNIIVDEFEKLSDDEKEIVNATLKRQYDNIVYGENRK